MNSMKEVKTPRKLKNNINCIRTQKLYTEQLHLNVLINPLKH